MKNYILLFGLALLSLTSIAQTKVGTIDADYILSQMPEMTQVQEEIKTYDSELQKELESNISEYEKLVKEYQDNKASYTEEQKKEKEGAIISLENNLKGFRQKASVMIQMKQNQLTQPLYEKINTAMQQVVKEEGYTQILRADGTALAYSAEEFDITAKVMTKLGIQVQQ